ncbi:hypothetical protein ACFQ2I_12080 [Paenibacillus chungangensis]|uniref:Uncharacterized protein n=1 Tax=Paenibacillus chungangensis TaxID=696535 RepID=A0ABW3HRF1_9BACL
MGLSYIAKKAYFDTIPHEKLISMVKETVVDGSVLSLLEKCLKAGVMDGGSFHINEQGTPQGGLCKALHKPPYAKKVIMRSKPLEPL